MPENKHQMKWVFSGIDMNLLKIFRQPKPIVAKVIFDVPLSFFYKCWLNIPKTERDGRLREYCTAPPVDSILTIRL